MPAPLIAAGIGLGVAGIVTSLISAGMQREQAEKLAADLERLADQYRNLDVPEGEALQLALEDYKYAGDVTPQVEQVIRQGITEMENISVDPRYKEAQLQALDELQRIGQGGLRLSDKAAQEELLGGIGQAARGREEAIKQDLLQRGALGSGAEIAMRQASAQAAAEQAHRGGLGLAAQAQDRALQAILSGGQLGGQIRGQEFGEQERIARAQDITNAFNVANEIGTQRRNVGRSFEADIGNRNLRQSVGNLSTGARNEAARYNVSLPWQQYNARLAKLGGQTELQSQASKARYQGGMAWPNAIGGIGQAAIGAGGQIAAYGMQSPGAAAPAGAAASPVAPPPQAQVTRYQGPQSYMDPSRDPNNFRWEWPDYAN